MPNLKTHIHTHTRAAVAKTRPHAGYIHTVGDTNMVGEMLNGMNLILIVFRVQRCRR